MKRLKQWMLHTLLRRVMSMRCRAWSTLCTRRTTSDHPTPQSVISPTDRMKQGQLMIQLVRIILALQINRSVLIYKLQSEI